MKIEKHQGVQKEKKEGKENTVDTKTITGTIYQENNE